MSSRKVSSRRYAQSPCTTDRHQKNKCAVTTSGYPLMAAPLPLVSTGIDKSQARVAGQRSNEHHQLLSMTSREFIACPPEHPFIRPFFIAAARPNVTDEVTAGTASAGTQPCLLLSFVRMTIRHRGAAPARPSRARQFRRGRRCDAPFSLSVQSSHHHRRDGERCGEQQQHRTS